MILQALVSHYDRLLDKGELERPGWQSVKVSFALDLDEGGHLKQVLSLQAPVMRGKKQALAPQALNLPEQGKRTVGVSANFLCDNASYLLGIDNKGKPQRTLECFAACQALHQRLLAGADHPAARAILGFFDNWQPRIARQHPALQPYLEDILSGANLIFFFKGEYAQDIPQLRQAWDRDYANRGEGTEMQCLVTGQRGKVAVLHPSIKGVQGAQATGASLVSFNARAYESYGREDGQGLNAPVSTRAAFAYGAALNHLVSDADHRLRLGDSTVVFWAEDAEMAYTDCFSAFVGADDQVKDKDVRGVMDKLAAGLEANWDQIPLSPSNRFYVLGLAPNAARLSVRFFLRDSFGAFARHMQRHQQDLEVVRPAFAANQLLPLWRLLGETVNQNSRDKSPSPQLAGELTRSVLAGTPYPATLFTQVQLRIRAEREVTWGRAAIIKAYLLRNTQGHKEYANYKEALSVELNENTTYPPYLLGRLFSVLEGLQQAANPGINATIRDRYFNSACATPAVVFPILVKLAQSHLKKLQPQGRVYYDKQIGQIQGMIHQDYPTRLSLYDQGVFQLGYYHQTQKRYQKKEEKDNG